MEAASNGQVNAIANADAMQERKTMNMGMMEEEEGSFLYNERALSFTAASSVPFSPMSA